MLSSALSVPLIRIATSVFPSSTGLLYRYAGTVLSYTLYVHMQLLLILHDWLTYVHCRWLVLLPSYTWTRLSIETWSLAMSSSSHSVSSARYVSFSFPFSILKFESDIINFIRNLRLLWFGNVTYLLYTCMSCDSHVIYMYVHVHVAALGFFLFQLAY